MPPLRRLVVLALVSVVVSAALMVLITGRGIDEQMVPFYWAKMLLAGDPPAPWLAQWLGNNPPRFVMRLAVIWHRADPVRWWWLPLLVMAASLLLGRRARRRSQLPPRG